VLADEREVIAAFGRGSRSANLKNADVRRPAAGRFPILPFRRKMARRSPKFAKHLANNHRERGRKRKKRTLLLQDYLDFHQEEVQISKDI